MKTEETFKIRYKNILSFVISAVLQYASNAAIDLNKMF